MANNPLRGSAGYKSMPLGKFTKVRFKRKRSFASAAAHHHCPKGVSFRRPLLPRPLFLAGPQWAMHKQVHTANDGCYPPVPDRLSIFILSRW